MEKTCIICKAKAIYKIYDKYMTKEFCTCEGHIDEIIHTKIGKKNTVNIKRIN